MIHFFLAILQDARTVGQYYGRPIEFRLKDQLLLNVNVRRYDE